MSIVIMFYNNCPSNGGGCVGRRYLRRFSFQPLKENPLLGPSAATSAGLEIILAFSYIVFVAPFTVLSCIKGLDRR
ncbi:hypothetical protein EJB05_40644 [Eragrostis curvula]|uniref:Uncharacterized protein n=1 Tax=Eragrostis curvula TaxID=38414 RepID=A0A5J9TQG5_9POAL|nr:hypothetical protein EJB05_40644 [Eragrostis curvula]